MKHPAPDARHKKNKTVSFSVIWAWYNWCGLDIVVGVFGQTEFATGALAGLDPFLQAFSMYMFAGPVTVTHRQQWPTFAVFQTDSTCHGTTYASLYILGVFEDGVSKSEFNWIRCLFLSTTRTNDDTLHDDLADVARWSTALWPPRLRRQCHAMCLLAFQWRIWHSAAAWVVPA